MNSSLLLTINGWAGHNQLLDKAMIFCASDLVYIVFAVTAVCIGYLLYKKQWKAVAYFFVTLVVTYILLRLASLLNFDHRPFMDHHLTQLVAHEPGKSFPSDHTTVTAGIAFGLLLFTRFKRIGIAVLIAACLIGFSRIFVGVHYPLDIAGGLITGFIGGCLVLAAKQIIDRRTKEPAETSHQVE